MRAGHNPDLSTWALAFIGKLEEPDLVDGEAKLPGPADKSQPFQVVVAVEAVTPRTSRRVG